jgi:inosine/xanthosine triphosphate pyrophosphatase family protein
MRWEACQDPTCKEYLKIEFTSRWFLENLKPEGLNKMIAKFEDKTAYAQCIIGYMDRSLKEPKLFIGRTNVKF